MNESSPFDIVRECVGILVDDCVERYDQKTLFKIERVIDKQLNDVKTMVNSISTTAYRAAKERVREGILTIERMDEE
jgi:hypothetical protein